MTFKCEWCDYGIDLYEYWIPTQDSHSGYVQDYSHKPTTTENVKRQMLPESGFECQPPLINRLLSRVVHRRGVHLGQHVPTWDDCRFGTGWYIFSFLF